ncbi:MAG: cold shock domain-containing protein [Burkholderiaceae bacterium]|jgi:cold shock CspA family protein|nr:cold shock domain-containing protein [Burkholderiaceae bacterium]
MEEGFNQTKRIVREEYKSLANGKVKSGEPKPNRQWVEHSPDMLEGMVKFYDPNRKFGFILGADGVDWHFREADLVERSSPLAKGMRVMFLPVEDQKGSKASQVSLGQ